MIETWWRYTALNVNRLKKNLEDVREGTHVGIIYLILVDPLKKKRLRFRLLVVLLEI